MTLRHLVLHNGWIKLTCVVVATVLWVILNSSQHGNVEAQPLPDSIVTPATSGNQSVTASFHPDTTIVSEDRLTQRVAIVPSTIGRALDGRQVASLMVTPDSVDVSAPASFFSQLEPLFTEPIALDQIEETSNVTVALVLPVGVKLVDPTYTAVTVTITVDDAP